MEFKVIPARTIRRSRDFSFNFGIEEEYFLCNEGSLQPAMRTPDELFAHRSARTGTGLNREMLQAQIEVTTRPHTNCQHARDELIALRATAAEAAAEHGLTIIGAGTHPTANWRESVHSPKERYRELMDGLQIVGRRNMLCGMHVHVELPDADSRIDVMTRMLPYLPLILALSTSSPFWHAECTGLKGYRLTAYDELPRTGMPELFRTSDEYEAYVAALTASGAIPDASHVWWSIRPSHKYPTLELRAPDCCTRLDHALAIAALYRCLVRHLYLNAEVNADLDAVDRAITVENKWRAQRFGVEASFVSPAGAIKVSDMLDAVIEQVASDAETMNCLEDVLDCRSIVTQGSSADEQLRRVRDDATDSLEMFRPVLQWLARTTLANR
jgi:glutamate---cysteine ligase / carboxylate-amine ligase